MFIKQLKAKTVNYYSKSLKAFAELNEFF